MSELRVTPGEVSLWPSRVSGEIYAASWSTHVTVDIAESEHAGVSLTPEEAIRFGFHLAGLGAKALRTQR